MPDPGEIRLHALDAHVLSESVRRNGEQTRLRIGAARNGAEGNTRRNRGANRRRHYRGERTRIPLRNTRSEAVHLRRIQITEGLTNVGAISETLVNKGMIASGRKCSGEDVTGVYVVTEVDGQGRFLRMINKAAETVTVIYEDFCHPNKPVRIEVVGP